MMQVEALRQENERVQREIAATESASKSGKRRSNGAAAAEPVAATEAVSSTPAAPSLAAEGERGRGACRVCCSHWHWTCHEQGPGSFPMFRPCR